jgi:hypothetical protein
MFAIFFRRLDEGTLPVRLVFRQGSKHRALSGIQWYSHNHTPYYIVNGV